MAAGAEFWLLYSLKDNSNGVSYNPPSEDFSSELSGTPKYAVFSDSDVIFYDISENQVGSLSFVNPYVYNGVSYQLEQIHFNGVDATNETFDVPENGCQIVVYYGYDPESGGNDVGGENQGGNQGGNSGDDTEDEEPVNPTPDVAPTPFSFTVKFCKNGTSEEVYDEIYVNECYYLIRNDLGTVGDYGDVYLKYYTGTEWDGSKYIYTGEQTQEIWSTIDGYKLDSFPNLANGQYITGSKDGQTDYPLYAYYIDNDFEVTIDSKGIDRSQVIVQDPNHTNLKYNLPYTDVFHNTALLLEAITNNEEYEFDYWEVNGTKIYNRILRYEIESDLQIYCCFKEKTSASDIEDDKIATNDDIHTIIENSSLYPINADENSDYLSYRCPTKYDILNNNYTTSDLSTNAGQLINISGTYTDDQCVKFEDISFNKRKIKIRLYNDKDKGIDALGDTTVTFYASENYSNSISTGDTELISIHVADYQNQTGPSFDASDSINVEYTLPNYNIFDMYIKIKIHGKYAFDRRFRMYCKNNSTTNWMDQSDNVLPGGSAYKDTVKGYTRKYNYFIKITNNAEPNLCVVFYA